MEHLNRVLPSSRPLAGLRETLVHVGVAIFALFSLGSNCSLSQVAGGGASVVDAGADQTVNVGDIVRLMGTSQGVASHKWELMSRPPGSTAVISNELSLTNAALIPDVEGEYVAKLIGAVSNNPTAPDVNPAATDVVTITAVRPTMDGGTGGSGGTGGFTIDGEVVDQDMMGLDGVSVRAILGEAGVTSVFTDSGGMFSLEVAETGAYRLCAVGAISDSLPRRFVSTNCGTEDDQVAVSASSNDPSFSEVSITSGYYMEITNAPFDVAEPEGEPIPVFDMSYHVWNRTGVGQTRTFIVVGIEGSAQFTHEIANAGPYTDQTQAAMGVAVDVALTAAPGTIYARLLPVATAMVAMMNYESGFLTSARQTNYVAIGTVTTP